MTAESPTATLIAGSTTTISIYYQAFHPGDCSIYISYDIDKVAPVNWLALGHFPGCAVRKCDVKAPAPAAHGHTNIYLPTQSRVGRRAGDESPTIDSQANACGMW